MDHEEVRIAASNQLLDAEVLATSTNPARLMKEKKLFLLLTCLSDCLRIMTQNQNQNQCVTTLPLSIIYQF